ncbi:adaptin ear-binding coat-associated protein 2 isoform X2 [Nannospalax galili]|uniref:adaptin ear-binding coat-associated protein 2 isoform X2 n=1 Tax=Nannospalax galili TaxID=1026970 RepID=UPI0004ED53B0|nr:adaptin ear-binding coat-associated protein 2 isoform X2 [Nannospalax galili]
MEEYESVLCVKPEVHVYRIPPRATNRGYRASEWQLDQPSWSGRLRITAKGQVAYIKLEDRTSGELFAQAPVDQFPSTAVESVTDSSRYFVIRIEDGNGRRAFIGIGFGDRGDAFDFNVALQDHFKWVKQQCEFAKQAQNPDEGPKLDLGFKEGQTIKINIANMKKKEGATGTSRARPASTGGLSLLPPPPGSKTSTLTPPSGEQLSVGGSLVQPAVAPGSAAQDHETDTRSHNLVPETIRKKSLIPSLSLSPCPLDLGTSLGGATVLWPRPKPVTPATTDIWGDFTKSTGASSSQSEPGTGWVQF